MAARYFTRSFKQCRNKIKFRAYMQLDSYQVEAIYIVALITNKNDRVWILPSNDRAWMLKTFLHLTS